VAGQSDKARILGMIHKERAALDSLLDSLSDAQMLDPTLPGGHTVKDLLLHIAAWERLFLDWMAAAARGETPALPAPGVTWDDVSPLNEQIYVANRDMALPAARVESCQAFRDFVAYIDALAPPDLIDPHLYPWLDGWSLVPLIASNSYQHYREHADEVRAWLTAHDADSGFGV
jgi:hypothetical protein